MTDMSETAPEPVFTKKLNMAGELVLPTLHAIGLDMIADAVGRGDSDTGYADFLVGLDEPSVFFADLSDVQTFADVLLGWQGKTDRDVQQLMYDYPEQIAVPLIEDRTNYGIVAGMLGEQLHFQTDVFTDMDEISAIDDVAEQLRNPEEWLEP